MLPVRMTMVQQAGSSALRATAAATKTVKATYTASRQATLPRLHARHVGRLPASTLTMALPRVENMRHRLYTSASQPPLVRLQGALIPDVDASIATLSLTVPDTESELWAVVGPAASSGAGAKVMAALLSIVSGRTRPWQSDAAKGRRIHPAPHPFAGDDTSRIGFASFSKQDTNSGGNDFHHYASRYGALREEDHVTLFEQIMHEQGFEVGNVAAQRILPDALQDVARVNADVHAEALATKALVERFAPLLGLHKPGPGGSATGVPLLHQPVISLSNGQTRRARICGALVHLARRQQHDSTARKALLVLDQPFSGLDEPSRDELSALLNTLHTNGAPRVLLALRRQDELPAHVTHVVDIDSTGRIWSGTRAAWQAGTATQPKGVKGIRANHSAHVGVGYGDEVARLRDVRVQYGNTVVLDSIHLTIRQGTRLVVKGANGSGKTTLLALLTGTHPRSYALDGSMYALFGRPRSAPGNATRLLQRRIGYFGPDLLAAFPRRSPEVGGMSVEEAIASGYEGVFSRTQIDSERQARIRALFSLFADCIAFRGHGSRNAEEASSSIDEQLRRPFMSLHAGSQALVLILRAVVHQPALLVLDEPFQGMDAVQVDRVRKYIDAGTGDKGEDEFAVGATEADRAQDRQARRNAAVVLVSHYVNEWPDRMGEFIKLHDGRIVERVGAE